MRRAVLVVFTIAVVAVLLAAWRLRQGPISMDALLPRIEQLLNPEDAKFHVDIEGAALEWVDWRHPIGLALDGVRVGVPGSTTTVSLPSLAVGLSGRALLAGTIAPAWIQVREPVVHLTRASEGAVEVTLTSGERVAEDSAQAGVIEGVLGELAGASESTGRFGGLRSLEIVGGEIHVTDEALDRTLSFTGANLDLWRVPEGVSGALETDVTVAQDTARLEVKALYRAREGSADAEMTVADLDSATLAFLLPGPASDMVDVQLALSASAAFSISPGGDFRNGRFEVQGANGTVSVPEFWAAPRPVEYFRVQGQLEGRTLSISEAALKLGHEGAHPLRLTCTASAIRSESGDSVVAELTLDEFAVAAIGEYWPRGLAKGARDWVTSHVHTGTVRDSVFKLAVASDAGSDGNLRLQELDGAFRFDALNVSVTDALPEAQALAGNAKLSATDLGFDIVAGQVGDLRVSQGRVEVLGLGSDQERVDVDVRAVGTSQAILQLATSDLIEVVGVVGPASRGNSSVQARVLVPLPNTGGFDDLDVDVRASLGAIRLEHPFMSAQLSGEMRLTGDRGSARVLEVDMALHEPTFSLPLVGEQRPEPGYRGHARFAAYFEKGRARELRSIDLDGGAVRARGAIRFDEAGERPAAIDLDELQVGGTNLSGVRTRVEKGLVDIDVGGGVVDASAWTSANGEGGDGIDTSSAFSLRAPRLERVSFASDRFVENLSLVLGRSEGRWQRIHFTGRVPRSLRTRSALRTGAGVQEDRGDIFQVDWNRARRAGGALRGYVGDVGGLLRATGLSEGILGGELRVTGTAADADPLLVRAQATGSDFAVTSSSIMFRVLGLASGRGILQSPRGDQIPFDELSADVVFDGQRLDVERAIARGTVFAVTTAGRVDLQKGRVDMRGEIVPAYELTRLLGKIPVVGGFLLGDGHVVGVAYGVSGSLREPALSVDPLGTLTPAVLRRLLGQKEQPGKR